MPLVTSKEHKLTNWRLTMKHEFRFPGNQDSLSHQLNRTILRRKITLFCATPDEAISSLLSNTILKSNAAVDKEESFYLIEQWNALVGCCERAHHQGNLFSFHASKLNRP